MDWNTLFPVIVGGLIATIPILISNLVQIYIKRMEIKQKEKEARIQDKKKWIERDILAIMDTLDDLLNLLSEYQNIKINRIPSIIYLKQEGLLTQDEYIVEAKSRLERLEIVQQETKQKKDTVSRLVYSFDEDISSEYEVFTRAYLDYFQGQINLKEGQAQVDFETWYSVKESAGKLQGALREKLISIRDEET